VLLGYCGCVWNSGGPRASFALDKEALKSQPKLQAPGRSLLRLAEKAVLEGFLVSTQCPFSALPTWEYLPQIVSPLPNFVTSSANCYRQVSDVIV